MEERKKTSNITSQVLTNHRHHFRAPSTTHNAFTSLQNVRKRV